jgi:hypothetical protein
VRRTGNATAHGLAKAAILRNNEQIWMEETPPCIKDIVHVELSALVV